MAGKRFTVDAVFRGINKISKPVRSMGRSISNFVRQSNKKIALLGERFKKLGKSISKGLAIGAVAALSLAMVNTIAVGAEFEQTMVSAAAKFPGLIRQGTEEFKALEDAAKATGKVTEFTATQTAGALNFLAMAGFNAQQSIAALPGVVDLATAANIELQRATDIATDTLGAFGLATKDPIKLAGNLARVNDVLAKTTTTANTDMEQLFESIAAGAADFNTAGQSMESFAALTGVMANAGKKGEAAGTVLRNIMVRLADPVVEAASLLEDMGVKTADQAGNFRDVIDIIADVEKGLKGMGTAQKTAAISTIFGLRAQGGINILLKKGSKEIRKYRQGLIDAKGTNKSLADTMRDTLKGSFNTAMSALEGLGLTVFGFLKGPIRGLVDSFTGVVRAIDQFVLKITNATGFLKVFIDFAKPFIGILLAFKGVLIAIAIATKLWATAQGILNAVLLVSPVTLIFIAIAALVGIIVVLVKNWDTVVAAFKSGIESIWNWFSGLLDNPFFVALGTIFLPFITIPALIVKHWEPIKEMFSDIVGLVSNVGSTIGGFFGIGDEEGGENAKPVTPQERISRSFESSENNSTLTIKDRTGTAELSPQKRGGPQIALATSGGL